MRHRSDVGKLLSQNAHRHHLWDVFRDFVAMAAYALSNPLDILHRKEREADYMRIVRKYEADEVSRMGEALAMVVDQLEEGFDDVLGQLFMSLDLGNKWHGQFFTPYHLCRMMAKMQLEGVEEIIERKGYVSVMDPCIGGGAMVIAIAEALHEKGVNYQQHMHAHAIDIDATAVHMSFIQFSLLSIPAVVYRGNSLSNEMHDVWYTPMHIIGGWNSRLKANEESKVNAPEMVVQDHKPEQLTLFESQAEYNVQSLAA